jgi:Flp pilus assembly protein TadB
MLSKEFSKGNEKSWLRNLGRFVLERPCINAETEGRIYFGQAVKAVAGLGVLTLCAAAFYRVRELLAAMILFSAVFGVVMVAVLILWFVGEATHEAAGRLEKQMARIPARHVFVRARAHADHIHRNPRWN